MPVGVIERAGPSLAPACLFACSVLPNGQPRASRASSCCCCCSAQPRRLRLSFSHVSNTYMCVSVCITSRNADLIFRHSHPLRTRTFACATMIAASVPTHAVAQGRRQLSLLSMSISYQCGCIHPYHHPLLAFVGIPESSMSAKR